VILNKKISSNLFAMESDQIDWAIKTFMELVNFDSSSGWEGQVAAKIELSIKSFGIPGITMQYDNAHKNFAQHGKSGIMGNLIINIPATQGLKTIPTLGFNAHMDRVEPGKCIKPRFNSNKTRIVSDGTTILAADDCAGIAVILTMIKVLKEKKLAHGPLQLIFTVSEEYRVLGSRYIDTNLLNSKMIFSFDGGEPDELILGACSSDKYRITITGKNAHAGMHPEQGISALRVFTRASGLFDFCWGKRKEDDEHVSSANFVIVDHDTVGTNSTQAKLVIAGEARSIKRSELVNITNSVRGFLKIAAKRLPNDKGERAKIEFKSDRAYNSFKLSQRSAVTKHAVYALMQNDIKPRFRKNIMSGLDACWLNHHGIPTIPMGIGAHNLHQPDEYLDIKEFIQACNVAVSLASSWIKLKNVK